VVFSYCTQRPQAEEVRERSGTQSAHGTPAEAGLGCREVLLLAVHWLRMDGFLKQTGDLSGKVIVTCSLPMDADNSGLVIGHMSSGAEELAKKVPKAKVVCALQHGTELKCFFRVHGALDKVAEL
jgi:8-hydroxy-5-deazaflavin:NADPH oxidoreductase